MFQCDDCGFSSYSAHVLNMHRTKKHPKYSSDSLGKALGELERGE